MTVPRGLTDSLVRDGFQEFLDIQREQDQQENDDASAHLDEIDREQVQQWADAFWSDLGQGYVFDPIKWSNRYVSLSEHLEIIETWVGELPPGVREDYTRRVLELSSID